MRLLFLQLSRPPGDYFTLLLLAASDNFVYVPVGMIPPYFVECPVVLLFLFNCISWDATFGS